MTGPLSSAAAGMHYSGTGFGGELAKLAAGLVQGRRTQEESNRKAALEAALQSLRVREADQGDARLKLGQGELDLGRSKAAQDAINAHETQNLGYERLRADNATKGTDDKRLDATLTETQRHNRATEALGGERVDATRTGRGLVVTQGPNGEIMIVDKGQGTVSPTHAAGAAVPTGGDGTPQGSGARPSQGEREAAASYENLQTQFDVLKHAMGKVHNTPPGAGTQLALDGTKSTGLGPISSLTRSLSNAYVGSQAPEYQETAQAIDALGSSVIKMITGAQMSEPEAQRIMNLLKFTSGDTPETVQQKLETVQNIISSQKVKQGRAAMGGGTSGAAPAGAPPANAKAFYDSLRAQGKSAEEALQMTDAKYPR